MPVKTLPAITQAMNDQLCPRCQNPLLSMCAYCGKSVRVKQQANHEASCTAARDVFQKRVSELEEEKAAAPPHG